MPLRMTRLLAALVVCGAAAGFVDPSADAATPKVTVKATEMKFALSVKRVPVGSVRFAVTNKGQLEHDFSIRGKKTRLLAHGKSGSIVVKFPKAGRYSFLCTVPGHAKVGMKGSAPGREGGGDDTSQAATCDRNGEGGAHAGRHLLEHADARDLSARRSAPCLPSSSSEG